MAVAHQGRLVVSQGVGFADLLGAKAYVAKLASFVTALGFTAGSCMYVDEDVVPGGAESATDFRVLCPFERDGEDAADGEMALAQPGCLFVSFVYEQVPDTDAVRPLIVEAIEHWRSRITDKLTLAREAARLPGDIDLDSLADHVFTTFEGAFILARATDDPTHVRSQLGHLRRYLQLLLDPAPGSSR